MKINLIKLCCLALFIFTVVGCKDCKECETQLELKTEELTETNQKLSACISQLRRGVVECEKNTTPIVDAYRPEQQQRKFTPEELQDVSLKRWHFNTEGIRGNYFNTSIQKGEIHLNFPVHNPKGKTIEIIDVIDVSSSCINAIVVLLDGLGGLESRGSNTTHFLSTIIEVDKVKGLNNSRLAEDRQLLVYIFHDDAFYDDQLLEVFEGCVADLQDKYDGKACILPQYILTDKAIDEQIKRPREQEGDIIVGG